MSRTAAAITADMLVGVIQEGTGKQAAALKHPLAGKTGTTDEYRDALFIGFSPSIAAGVWVGKDRGGSLGDRETGARAALPIWLGYMKEVLADQAVDYFDIPDNVVRISFDPVSGRTMAAEGAGCCDGHVQKRNGTGTCSIAQYALPLLVIGWLSEKRPVNRTHFLPLIPP